MKCLNDLTPQELSLLHSGVINVDGSAVEVMYRHFSEVLLECYPYYKPDVRRTYVFKDALIVGDV